MQFNLIAFKVLLLIIIVNLFLQNDFQDIFQHKNTLHQYLININYHRMHYINKFQIY